MPRRLGTAALMLGLAIAICFVSLWLLARYQRASFEELAKQVSALQVGKSSFIDAKQLADRYRPHVRTTPENCDAHSCEFTVILTNFLVDRAKNRPPDGRWFNFRAFRRLGIRPALAVATATVKDGTIQEVRFDAAYEGTRGEWLYAEWTSMIEFPPMLRCQILTQQRHPGYVVSTGRAATADMPGRYVSVTFGKVINDTERNRCEHIKFDCMTNVSECGKDIPLAARAFMPLISQDVIDDDALRRSDPEKYATSIDQCLRESQGRVTGPLFGNRDGKP